MLSVFDKLPTMSSYVRKVLGMVQLKEKPTRSPFTNLTNTVASKPVKATYDLPHMKNFLESVKTPAEIR